MLPSREGLAPLVAEAPIRRAITFSASALALTLAAWLCWALWRNHRANNTQPFARALRELRGLDDREPRAWQILHRAFDRAAGRVIQTATLPELFERMPQLIPLRERIEDFFTQSSLLFFRANAAPAPVPAPPAEMSPANAPLATGSHAPAPVAPQALCQELRRIERRYEP